MKYAIEKLQEEIQKNMEMEMYPAVFYSHLQEVIKAAERYEKVRKLNPRQFSELWDKNLKGDKSFDELVDELK